MKRPDKLRILGKTYRIAYLRRAFYGDSGDELNGECILEQQKIKIRHGLGALEERETVLHEAMHGVEQTMGVKISEADLTRMAAGVLALLTDNPEFAAYLVSKE